MSHSVFNREPGDSQEIKLCRACFSDAAGLRKMSGFVLMTYCQLTNTALKPDENPLFPKYICYTCLALLKKLYHFRNNCQQSYLQMHKMALWNKLNTRSLHKLHNPKPLLSKPDPDFIRWNIQSYVQNVQSNDYSEAVNRCTDCDRTKLGTTQCYAVNKVVKKRKSKQNKNPPVEPVENANDGSPIKVFVAGCTKGKRTTQRECKRDINSKDNVITYAAASLLSTEDSPNAAAHNSVKRTAGIDGMNTTPTVQDNRGMNYAAIALQNSQNPAALRVNKSVIGNQAGTMAVVLDNNDKNYLLNSIAPVIVLNNGVIEMSYTAALAVLDQASCVPMNAQNHLNQDKPPTAISGPKHLNLTNLTSTDNTVAQNSNIGGKHAKNVSDKTDEVAAVKMEIEDDQNENTPHNYEENFNGGELTEVKSELDDIVKVEHLIHPVDDDGIDGQEILQQNYPNHKQHTEETKTSPNSHNIEVNEQNDDKVVEIDDSSSSSSSSSDSSSSSSSSSVSSRKTNNGVDEIDLTLDDDDLSVDAKHSYKIPDPCKVLKNKNCQLNHENVVSLENTKVAGTDGISNKVNLLGNTNLDVRNEPSATENDENLNNFKDMAKHLSTTKLVEKTDKNVESATKIPEHDNKNVKSQVKNSENKANNIEEMVFQPKNVETVIKIVGNKPKIIEKAANNVEPITKIVEDKVKIIENVVKTHDTTTNIVEGTVKNIETTTKTFEDKAKIIKDAAKTDDSTTSIVEGTVKNFETTNKSLEGMPKNIGTITKILEDTAKVVEGTAKIIAESKTIKPTIHSSYYNDDSSSDGSDDLPDCLIGFSKEVYRNDIKRNFTGPEFSSVEKKKQKIMFMEAEDLAFKKWRAEEALSKRKRNPVHSKTKKRHTSLEIRNNKSRNTHPMRDSIWRRRRDKLRAKLVENQPTEAPQIKKKAVLKKNKILESDTRRLDGLE